MLTFLLYAAGMMAQPDWGYNPNAYSDEHVVYACLVDADGLQVGGQFTYLGAFIDGECRGLVRSEFGTSGSFYYFPLRIKGTSSDQGKSVTFRFRNTDGLEYVIQPQNGTFTYDNGATTGIPSNLFKLLFQQPRTYSLTQQNISVNVGESVDMMQYIRFIPENASVPMNIEWDFANSSNYFAVDDNILYGRTPTVNEGYLGVKVGTLNPTGDVNSFRVTVIQPATSITLKEEYRDGVTVPLNGLEELTNILQSCYDVTPADCNEELLWKSNDETAIVPDENLHNGFTPVKTGTYTMTLSGSKASVDLKVTVIKPVTHIEQVGELKEVHIYVGESLTKILPAGFKVMPEDATDTSVSYRIEADNNNTTVLSNQDNGDIVGTQPGRARVIVSSNQNPQAMLNINVVVHKKINSMTFKKPVLSFILEAQQRNVINDVRANIVFDPEWPVYDDYNDVEMESSNEDVFFVQHSLIAEDMCAANVNALGEATVTVKYYVSHTEVSANGLTTQNDELTGSFTVRVVEGLKGFTINVVDPPTLGRQATVEITPNPATAPYEPKDVQVQVDWNAQFPDGCPDTWTIATIQRASEDGQTWTLLPKSMGHGTIRVVYGKIVMGSASFTVGQPFDQKAGWSWNTFLGNMSEDAMHGYFDEAVEEIRSENDLMYNDPKYGYFGTLTNLVERTCYKVKIGEEPGYVSFVLPSDSYAADINGEAEYRPQWNWLSYNSQFDLTMDQYFNKEKFSEGDRIVSKNEGFATYTANGWEGTLEYLRFGQGYMYYNASGETKLISYASDSEFDQPTDREYAKSAYVKSSVWTYNSAPFADNMTIIADLGSRYGTDNYSVGAFVGDECRGEGRMVGGKCFITVHADKGETISFRLYDELTGEMRMVNEQMPFADMAGTMKRPVKMTLGESTAIDQTLLDRSGIAVIDGQLSIQGMSVVSTAVVNTTGAVVLRNQTDLSSLPSGVYIVKVKTTDGKTITKKIMK